MPKRKDTVVTLTGPSCSGKSTLARYLSGQGIPEVRSFTTRDKRPGETDGVEYDFCTREWASSIPEDQLIERVEFKGNIYGNTLAQLREAFDSSEGVAVVVVEPAGVLHWSEAAKRHGFNHYSVYLQQPQPELIKRMGERIAAMPTERMGYEFERLAHMIEVEHPTWPRKFDYELVVPNLGCGESYTDIAQRLLTAFLLSSFARPI